MGDVREVRDVVWSDIYYDQASSLVDYLLGECIGVSWCSRDRLRYMRKCLCDMAKMNGSEEVWDYGERSVRLSLPGDIELGIYRLMSEHARYGFSFNRTDSSYSTGLLCESDVDDDVESAAELHKSFKRDRLRLKRKNRENTAASCLERYIDDCRRHDSPCTMEGYVAACGSRRLGRRIWRKYMM